MELLRNNFIIIENLSIFAQVFFMRKVDYIIVGDGFASLFFVHQLLMHNKSFVIFSDSKRGASKISAGMVNPVIVKKFTTFPDALHQIDVLSRHLAEMEVYLKQPIRISEPVYRIFHDEKEKQTWFRKAQNDDLRPFLDTTVYHFDDINAVFGAGKVMHSFRVDVPVFFNAMQSHLRNLGNFIEEQFNHSELNTHDKIYKDFSYTNIVFAEGIAVKNNPYFKNIPIVVNKGHHLTVRIPGYALSETLKKKFFLFPLNKNAYYYGGTYDRDNDSNGVDDRAQAQLVAGLEEMIPQSYKIDEIPYAFRPTLADRKPVLGSHPFEKNVFVFNGLGTRGLLNAAVYSEKLFDYIETNSPLPHEVDVTRFS